eukprot:3461583-Prymnesium_polylepis.1
MAGDVRARPSRVHPMFQLGGHAIHRRVDVVCHAVDTRKREPDARACCRRRRRRALCPPESSRPWMSAMLAVVP